MRTLRKLVSLSLTLGLVHKRKPPFFTSPMSLFPVPMGTCGLPVLQGHGEHRSLLQACQEQGHHLCNSHAAGGGELVLFMQCGQKQALPTWSVPEGTEGAVGPGAFPTLSLISAPEQPLRSDSSRATYGGRRNSSRVLGRSYSECRLAQVSGRTLGTGQVTSGSLGPRGSGIRQCPSMKGCSEQIMRNITQKSLGLLWNLGQLPS